MPVELCLAQPSEDSFADIRTPQVRAHGQLESSNASTSACKCHPTAFADCVLLPLLPKCIENHTDTRRRPHSAHTRQARRPQEHKHTRQEKNTRTNAPRTDESTIHPSRRSDTHTRGSQITAIVRPFRRTESPRHDGAIFQTTTIHHEAQDPHVTTEPPSKQRQFITKHRIPTSRRSHLPNNDNSSRSTGSPRHDGAIFQTTTIHHEAQDPHVTTEPSSKQRQFITKHRIPTSRRSHLPNNDTKHRIPTSRRSHLPNNDNSSRSTGSPRHNGAIFQTTTIHHEAQDPYGTTEPSSKQRHEAQDPHVTTEPSSQQRQFITKHRIPTSQRSHLPNNDNSSRSTGSPRHD